MISKKKERIGWYMYDWAISAFSATVVTVFIGPYLTAIAENAAGDTGVLNVLGLNIFPGSFFPYIVSLSVLLQVLFLPIMGAVADYTHKKKLILAASSYLGSFATMGMFFLEGDRYLLGGLLFIIANLSFGIAMVMYNAFLNDIAASEERDSVSSVGWATGYLGGGILLALNLFLFSQAESLGISTGMAIRINLASAGIWWGIFTLFPMIWLKIRRSPKSIPQNKNIWNVGFSEIKHTVLDAKKYPVTLLFLFAYLLYNDGVQAVIALSSQFGQEELGLDMSVLTQVILIVQFVAFAGALLFNYIASKTSTKTTLIITLAIWLIAVSYAYLGLYDAAGFYILGIVVGTVMGGTQALSRSLFANLIPKNKEAEYFSLYEVSERGTSWLGPLLFGLSLQFSGSYRIAILSLVVFFVLGIALLLKVNVQKGIAKVEQEALSQS